MPVRNVLYPTVFREPLRLIRARFPAPWSVMEVESGYTVLDARRDRITTIWYERGGATGLRQSHAQTLAQAIARAGLRTPSR